MTQVSTNDGVMRGECLALDQLSGRITLTQDGRDKFTVTYARQVKRDLSYAQAATELGACIMHALACDGRLDNRERGER